MVCILPVKYSIFWSSSLCSTLYQNDLFSTKSFITKKRGFESPEKIHAVARESCISAIGDEQLFLARLERVRLQGSSWSDHKVLVKQITYHKLFFGQINAKYRYVLSHLVLGLHLYLYLVLGLHRHHAPLGRLRLLEVLVGCAVLIRLLRLAMIDM